MDINDFIDKILNYEEEYEIIIETEDYNYYINYDDEVYKCSDLGNIEYRDLECLAIDLFNKIAKRKENIIEISN